MHVRWKIGGVAGVAVTGLVALSLVPTAGAAPQPMKYSQLTATQKRLVSGLASTEIDAARGALAARTSAAPRPLTAKAAANAAPFYFPNAATGCAYRLGANVNMDQDCQNVSDTDLSGRAQAQNETYISEDHSRPGNLLGSANDYRRGDGGCFGYYSLDDGRSFDDVAVPFGFTRGTAYGAAREYWGSGGDTSSAFDTRGNAYFSCQVFNRGLPASSNPDLSSALLVYRSTANGGASYTFPGRVVAEEPDVKGAGTAPFLDKQLLTVDAHVGSPFRDRVYVTWTTFAPDGTSYIYESHSADYAQTWSKPVVVSTTAASLCTSQEERGTGGDDDGGDDGDVTRKAATDDKSTCTYNQFSQPFTGSDGALYVTWANFNNTVTGTENRNQILLARSTDGGETFSAPVKVTDYYDLPDCATYTGQNAGRLCVPDKNGKTSFFRATNYPVGSVDPRDPKHVVVTVGSYINQHSNETNGCVPAGFDKNTGGNLFTGVLTVGACNNDILVSESRNAGAAFTGTSTDPRKLTTVTQGKRQATTDQWFQWADYTKDGRLAVSYYDRQYGDDELTGFSDFSLSGSRDVRSFRDVRVTSSSMPPPTQFGGTFWGDYTGLAAYHGTAHPAWSDTRTPAVFTCPGTATTTRAPALCTLPGTNAAVQNDQ
ncbi:MAG TPA: hypothetical protein VE781_06070, partial [Kineosporiaceae bacterium]|nr:hypothetical protein [Kineosporiaceae bacterium]